MKKASNGKAFKFQNLKERLLKIDRNLSCAEHIFIICFIALLNTAINS